ncbi:MAG: zinc-ribbon domain-containing protein [Deltaproteobacteria bacterium]|nr:zinc-ribbon domain-containing protein [Deltaproteobacteria bacterium]
MEISCEKCHSRFTVPDEKVPKDRVIKLACPKCRGSISVGNEPPTTNLKSKTAADGEEFRLRFIESKAHHKPAEESYGYEDYTGDQALEFFEEGIKLALVMAESREQSAIMRSAVEHIGYKFIDTPNTRDAIGKLRFHHFDLMILAEGFDGQSLDQSAILNYLNRLPMSVRRRIFLALVSERFKTMDNMMSFSMSANVVINTKDKEKIDLVLRKAIVENDRLCKVFKDTLLETGKL